VLEAMSSKASSFYVSYQFRGMHSARFASASLRVLRISIRVPFLSVLLLIESVDNSQVKNLDTGEEEDISDNTGSGDETDDDNRKSTIDEEQALLKSIANAFFDLAPKTIKVMVSEI
jgi:hypothetical protein